MPNSVLQIAQIAAPVAAVASAIAAYLSRATVERANRPFVAAGLYPHDPVEPGSTASHRARIELYSTGPGLALDVRCSLSVASDHLTRGRGQARKQQRCATSVIPALPAGDRSTVFLQTPDPDGDEPWCILLRWSDSAGRRWERTHEHSGHQLATTRRRIRGARLARRPWHWWWWSMWRRPYTVPPRITARQERQW